MEDGSKFEEVQDMSSAGKTPSDAISVSDPIRVGEGMQGYITYKVNVKGGSNLSSVTRRYSEFAWLHNALGIRFVGVILPPLPDKGLVEFIEARRAQLEQYLRRVAAHPTLSASPELTMFLTQAGDLAKGVKESDVETSGGGGWWGTLKDLQASAHLNLSQSGWIKSDVSLPYDVQCAEMKAYLTSLEAQLQAVQRVCTGLVGKHRELATSMSEFGLAVTLLGSCETDTQYLYTGLSQLGTSADRLSAVHHEQADLEVRSFSDQISEYLRAVGSAKEAIKGREKALQHYQNAIIALEGKKQKLAKLMASPQQSASKAAEVEREIAAADVDATKAREAHEQVAAVTRKEMERFQKDKVVSFKGMVIDYVKLQIEHSRKVQSVWDSLLPEIDALERESAKE
jgi:sorting nexin-1/2